MSEPFDPYYTWLAIPPEAQPPDLYRLAGVTRFENNLDVISHALDQRMTHVRTFQNGARAAQSQQLLNELSAARGVLLDAQRKQTYDRQLQKAQKPVPRGIPVAPAPAPAPAPSVSPTETYGLLNPHLPTHSPHEATKKAAAMRYKRDGANQALSSIIGGALAIVLLLGAGLVIANMFGGNLMREIADNFAPRPHQADPVNPPPPVDLAPAPEPYAPEPSPLIFDSDPTPPPADPSPAEPTETTETTEEPAGPADEIPSTGADPTARGTVTLDTLTEPVDLLASLRLPDDILHGSLAWDADRHLRTSMGRPDLVATQVAPPEQYVLEARVERLQNVESLQIGLVIGGRQTALLIDAYPQLGGFSGLAAIDGAALPDPRYPQSFRGMVFRPNRVSTVHVAVDGNRLQAWFDGRPLFRWEGDPRQVGTQGRYSLPEKPCIYFGSWESLFKIHSMKLLPYVPGFSPEGVAAKEEHRLPVPEEQVLAAARNEVKNILKEDYGKTRAVVEKAKFSVKLGELARETNDNAAMQYVLWEEAIEFATASSQLSLAFAFADELAAKFAIDVWQRKSEALKAVGALARTSPERLYIAETAQRLGSEAVAAKEYATALQLFRLGAGYASRGGDNRRRGELNQFAGWVEDLQKQIALGEQAAERLKTDPDNPKANFAYGRYLCLYQGNWRLGLAHLAKGDDAPLAAMVAEDEKRPTAEADQVALADRWWDLGQKSKDDPNLCLARAAIWYQLAESRLSGISRDRVQKRIVELRNALPVLPQPAP